jgi:predicted metalloprotease with PDZ domain
VTASRNYSNTAASAVLTSGASAVDTTIQVDTTSGFPSVPFVLVIDKDRVAEELVLCTAIVGLALTVTRAWGGTSAATHSAAATVKHVFTGTDAQDAGDHVGDEMLHMNGPLQWAGRASSCRVW